MDEKDIKLYWLGAEEHKEWFAPQAELLSGDITCAELSINNNGIIVIEAEYGESYCSFKGLRWLQKFRRESQSPKTPVIIYSFEPRESLIENFKFKILESPATAFLRLPFDTDKFQLQLEKLRPLNEEQLAEVILSYCGLQEEWQKLAHDLRNALVNYSQSFETARSIFDEWMKTVRRFAPAQIENVNKLERLLRLPPNETDPEKLKNAFRKLDTGLRFTESTQQNNYQNLSVLANIPQKPPSDYSKVLVANDTENLPLVNSLRIEYGYEVLKQATNATTAKRMFDAEKPQVVLADYYFKTEDDGLDFINYVANGKHNWSPLILVNSIIGINDKKLPKGVINFSGDHSHDAKYIHAAIWNYTDEPVDEVGDDTEQRADLPAGLSPVEDDFRRSLAQNWLPYLSFYISRWQKFPVEALAYVLSQLRARLFDKASDEELRILKDLIEILEPYEMEKNFSFQTITNLINIVGNVNKSVNELPETELSNDLHSFCHNFKSFTLTEVRNILLKVEESAIKLRTLPKRKTLASRIQATAAECRRDEFFLPKAIRLLKVLQDALAVLPSVPSAKIESKKISAKPVCFLIVEDDDDYRKKILLPITAEVKNSLEPLGFEIIVKDFDNQEDALQFVPAPVKTKNRRILKNGELERTEMIAIVDLYLPQNSHEAFQIKSYKPGSVKRNTAQRKQNGIDLIKELRRRGVSVIVFSTSGTDKDRREIQRLGVAKTDHISKADSDKKDRLIEALTRHITKVGKFEIEKLEEGSANLFRINGIEISLTPNEEKILEAIHELNVGNNPCTAQDILSRTNLRISRPGKHKRNVGEMVTQDTIKKYIYSIRNKIKKEFDKHGQAVGIEDIIETIPNFKGDKSGYRILAKKVVRPTADNELDDKSSKLSQTVPCKILVVENEADILEHIISVLGKIDGLIIESATNVEQAVKIAQKFRPDIVSLDLNIPQTQAKFDADPKAGDKNAGLDALEKIKLERGNIRALLLTTYFDDAELRSRAGRLGVSNEDVIPKFARENWRDELRQRIEQIRAELFEGKAADVLNDLPKPTIEILPDSGLENGVLNLLIDGVEPKKRRRSPDEDDVVNKIVGFLLLNAEKVVTFEEISEFTGKETDDKKRWDDWIRKCRKVVKSWLKIAVPHNADNNLAKKILFRQGNKLCLNVRVVNKTEI